MRPSVSYSPTFYDEQRQNSLRSAQEVVPYVIKLLHPKSVIDVGCGIGTWLKTFADHGIKEIKGIEGPWINTTAVLLPRNIFQIADLEKRIIINKRYDLACCLEVAEHLSEKSAKKVVAMLTKCSDVILFSAAVPGQGGTNHINEQWQSYWVDQFDHYNFVAVDCLRHYFWNNEKVEYWYSQNMLLFIKKRTVKKYPRLKPFLTKAPIYSIVHPKGFCRATKAEAFLQPLMKFKTMLQNIIRF